MITTVFGWAKQVFAGNKQQNSVRQCSVADSVSADICGLEQPPQVRKSATDIRATPLFRALFSARKAVTVAQPAQQAFNAFNEQNTIAIQNQVFAMLKRLGYELQKLNGPRNQFLALHNGCRYLVVVYHQPRSLTNLFERRIGLKQIEPVLGQANNKALDGVFCITSGAVGDGVYELIKHTPLVLISGVDLWRMFENARLRFRQERPPAKAA